MKTLEDIRIKAMELQSAHLDYLGLAFIQVLKCDIRDIELVQEMDGNKMTWHYRKKPTPANKGN